MEQSDIYKIAITRIPKVGPKALRLLISYCGGLEAVFKTKKSSLLKIPTIGPFIANQVCQTNNLIEAEETLKTLEKMKTKFHFYLDNDYPSRLKHFDDAPPIIFFKGNGDLNPAQTLSIVGTRLPTERGKLLCQKIVKDLSHLKLTVISGLAYGIDTAAHQACIETDLPTIGVLASGLPTIYPSENQKLAKRMMDKGGILTEFHPNHKLDPRQFPQRNRVIAMMSDAVLVVESKQKGGSMITASFGNQYHKDVFAFPGRPSDKMSLGCNKLIKQNKAALIESSHDLIEMMQWHEQAESKIEQGNLFIKFTPEEAHIMNILKQKAKINKDEIHYLSKIQISKVSAILLNLEFKGAIKTLPGNKYALL